MKKYLIVGFAFVLALSIGCEKTKLKKEQQGLVVQQSSAVRFAGYKNTVLWQGSPAEVDEYLRNPKYWDMKVGIYKFKPLSEAPVLKLGDGFKGKFELGKVALNAKFVMVNYKPGQEIWYLVNLENRLFVVLRFNLKESQKHTKVAVTGNSDISTGMGELLEVINLPEMLAKLVDGEVVKGQAHFDPTVNIEEALGSGNLGEFYESLLQQYQGSILINASLKKVNEYLVKPECWELFKSKYGIELSNCFIKGEPGPCPVKISLMGADYEFNTFTADYKYTDHMTSYGVLGQLICRFQIATKTEGSNTRLYLTFATELPSSVSSDAGDMFMSIMQLPKFLEQLLVNTKTAVEGAV